MSKADSVRQKARATTFLLQKSWIFTTRGNVWLSGALTYPVNYEAEKITRSFFLFREVDFRTAIKKYLSTILSSFCRILPNMRKHPHRK